MNRETMVATIDALTDDDPFAEVAAKSTMKFRQTIITKYIPLSLWQEQTLQTR
jgi:hypothetical protein